MSALLNPCACTTFLRASKISFCLEHCGLIDQSINQSNSAKRVWYNCCCSHILRKTNSNSDFPELLAMCQGLKPFKTHWRTFKGFSGGGGVMNLYSSSNAFSFWIVHVTKVQLQLSPASSVHFPIRFAVWSPLSRRKRGQWLEQPSHNLWPKCHSNDYLQGFQGDNHSFFCHLAQEVQLMGIKGVAGSEWWIA